MLCYSIYLYMYLIIKDMYYCKYIIYFVFINMLFSYILYMLISHIFLYYCYIFVINLYCFILVLVWV